MGQSCTYLSPLGRLDIQKKPHLMPPAISVPSKAPLLVVALFCLGQTELAEVVMWLAFEGQLPLQT